MTHASPHGIVESPNHMTIVNSGRLVYSSEIKEHTMSISISMHNVTKMVADKHKGTSWLEITDDTGAEVSLFIPCEVTQKIEQAWTEQIK